MQTRRSRSLRLRSLHVAAALAIVAAACAGTDGSTTDPGDAAERDTGEDVASSAPPDGPSVPERTFTTFDGDDVSLATTYAGEPLVVNFWASWCPPCIEEMPALEAIHQDLGDEITLVGVNLRDERDAAERTAELTGVTYDLVEDPDGVLYADFGGFTMPMTYLVDADGTVVASHGGFGTEEQFRELINEHLLP